MDILSIIWLMGMLCMIGYFIISYLKTKKILKVSIKIEEDTKICDDISYPFVFGFFHPYIYLPSQLDKKYHEYVLTHERMHISRKDYLWKPFAFILLSIYWFNPLCWISFALFSKDVELACDEMVILNKDNLYKSNYCQTLLNLSKNSIHSLISPLAFGEINIKERVIKMKNYKKTKLSYIILVAIISLGLVGCFATQPKEDTRDYFEEICGEYQVIDEDIGCYWHFSVLSNEGIQYLSIYDNGAGNPGIEGTIKSIDNNKIVVEYDPDLYEQLPSNKWSVNDKIIELTYQIVEKGIELTNNNVTIFFEKQSSNIAENLLTKYQEIENKNAEQTAIFINEVINELYGAYFNSNKLFCTDYGIMDDLFYATAYTDNEEYSIGVSFNTKTGELLTDASKAYHEKEIRSELKKMVSKYKTIKDFTISISSIESNIFIEDFADFIKDDNTLINVTVNYNNIIHTQEVEELIKLMKELNTKSIKGNLVFSYGDFISEEYNYNKTYSNKDIKIK